ncbi:MAG: hypothetical protein LUC85_07270 [Bacteroidales bacterium]|nr:hypothetical protein [Bacteroidales bacterium]
MTDKTEIEIRHLEMSRSLLDYLHPEPHAGYSRWDAYYDLIHRAISSCGQEVRFGQTFDLVPGEFVVTLSELARQWHWSRVTIRTFIKELCNLGQLVVTSHVKCSQVDMVSLRFQWGAGHHPFSTFNELMSETGMVKLERPSEKPLIILDEGDGLSDSMATTLLTDQDGLPLYTTEQRRHVALITDDIASCLYRRLLTAVYTPEVEKSMLDAYSRVCAGDESKLEEVVKGILTDTTHPLHLQGCELLTGIRDKAVKLFSAASQELRLKSARPKLHSEVEKPVKPFENPQQ